MSGRLPRWLRSVLGSRVLLLLPLSLLLCSLVVVVSLSVSGLLRKRSVLRLLYSRKLLLLMPFSPARKFKLEPLNRDERFLCMSRDLRLFLWCLLSYADGLGREVAAARTLREVFYEFDQDVQPEQIDTMLLELEERDWLLLYVSGRRILFQINPAVWAEFVSVDGRDGSRYPPPDAAPESAQRAAWGDSGGTAAEGKGGAGDGGVSGEGDRETPAWMLDPDMPPPQGCLRHPNNTGLIRCGPCAGARQIHTGFMNGEITHEAAVTAWAAGPR